MSACYSQLSIQAPSPNPSFPYCFQPLLSDKERKTLENGFRRSETREWRELARSDEEYDSLLTMNDFDRTQLLEDIEAERARAQRRGTTARSATTTVPARRFSAAAYRPVEEEASFSDSGLSDLDDFGLGSRALHDQFEPEHDDTLPIRYQDAAAAFASAAFFAKHEGARWLPRAVLGAFIAIDIGRITGAPSQPYVARVAMSEAAVPYDAAAAASAVDFSAPSPQVIVYGEPYEYYAAPGDRRRSRLRVRFSAPVPAEFAATPAWKNATENGIPISLLAISVETLTRPLFDTWAAAQDRFGPVDPVTADKPAPSAGKPAVHHGRIPTRAALSPVARHLRAAADQDHSVLNELMSDSRVLSSAPSERSEQLLRRIRSLNRLGPNLTSRQRSDLDYFLSERAKLAESLRKHASSSRRRSAAVGALSSSATGSTVTPELVPFGPVTPSLLAGWSGVVAGTEAPDPLVRLLALRRSRKLAGAEAAIESIHKRRALQMHS
jgi:hypothetical protein